MTRKPSYDDRCQHKNSDGRRCRMPRMSRQTPLCLSHFRRQQKLRGRQLAAAELLGPFTDFKTATAINHALGKVFTLLVQNRIPVRKAAVLGYLGQLLLHSVSSVKSEVILGVGFDGWEQLARRAVRPRVPPSAPEKPRDLPRPGGPYSVQVVYQPPDEPPSCDQAAQARSHTQKLRPLEESRARE